MLTMLYLEIIVKQEAYLEPWQKSVMKLFRE